MSKLEVKSTIRVSEGDVAVEYETEHQTVYFWNGNVLEGSFNREYIDILTVLLTEIRKEMKDE